MKFNEFKERIEQIFAEKFPGSRCECTMFLCLGCSIDIRCLLGKDRHEYPNMIDDNDAFRVRFTVDLPNRFDESQDLPENLTLEAMMRCIQTKPIDKVYFCGHKSIPFRKTNGTPEKLLKAFDAFTDRLFKMTIAEYRAGNLMPYATELIRRKNYNARPVNE